MLFPILAWGCVFLLLLRQMKGSSSCSACRVVVRLVRFLFSFNLTALAHYSLHYFIHSFLSLLVHHTTFNTVVALTTRIQQLQAHLKEHKKDKSGARGLEVLYVRRRKLLDYMQKKDFESYRKVVKTLGLVKAV